MTGFSDKDYQVIGQKDYIPFTEAIWTLIRLSVPMAFGILLRRVLILANFVFVGHMSNPNYVAGLGMGEFMGNIFGTSFNIGMAGAVITLSSQAFGKGENYLAGGFHHRAFIVNTVLFIPQAGFLYFGSDILIYIGQPEETARNAGLFIKAYLPGVWMYIQLETLRRYLSTQGEFHLFLKIQSVTLVIHITLLHIFINIYRYELQAVGYITCVTISVTYVSGVLGVTYLPNISKPNSWFWFNKDSFKGFKEFFKYGLPSAIMFGLEIYAFEALFLLSGYLGTDQQGATSIMMGVVALVFMTCLGFSFTGASFVGNNLGAGKPNIAKTYIKATLCICITLSISYFILLNVFKNQIMGFYTDHKEIIEFCTGAWLMGVFFIGFDIFQGVISGTIRAMGLQNFASYSCTIFYWFFGIPLSYIFTFKLNFGLSGLWAGMACGILCVVASYYYKIFTTDFQKLSEQIRERISHNQVELQDQSLSN